MKKTVLFLSLILFSIGGVVAQSFTPYSVNKEKIITITNLQNNSNYYRLGYIADQEVIGLGSNQIMENDYFVKISASMLNDFVGDSIVGARIGLAENLSNIKAFVRETPTGANLVEKIIDGTTGWNELKFDNSVTIAANKNYYIGYSATLPANFYAIGFCQMNLQQDALLISDLGGENMQDLTTRLGGSLATQALLSGNIEHFENKVQIAHVVLEDYYPINSTINIPVDIRNIGTNDITDIEFIFEYADKAPVVKKFSKNINSNTTEQFVFEEILMDASGEVRFTISKINGEDVSVTPYTANVIVFNSNDITERKILLEQFTTENCGYCPAGAKKIKAAIKNLKLEDKIIWIAHHAGFGTDSYTKPESEDYIRFYGLAGTFAPAMMLDRTVFTQLGQTVPVNGIGYSEDVLEERFRTALDVLSFVTVNIAQENSETKAKITVTGTYKGTLPAEDLYVNVYLTEDGLESYRQNGSSGKYIHNNVLRNVLGGANGTKITWKGNQYAVTVEKELDASWKKENLNVTAFVAKSYLNELDNVQVLNAERVKFSITDTTSDKLINTQTFSIYAVGGEILVDGKYDSFNVLDVSGKEVKNHALAKGVYLVKINTNNKSVVKKVVVF